MSILNITDRSRDRAAENVVVAPKKMKTFDQSEKSKKTVESMIKKGGKKAKEPAPPRKKKGKKKAVKEGFCLFILI